MNSINKYVENTTGYVNMPKVFPLMMVNTPIREKVLTLIKESHMNEFMSRTKLMSAHNIQLKDKIS